MSIEFEIAELLRRIENMLRLGTVAEIDHDTAKVRVQYDVDEQGKPILTNLIQWGVESASDNIEWNPPKIGEQVLIAAQSGNMAIAKVIARFYQTNFPAPSNIETLHKKQYSDDAVFSYDTSTKQFDIILPAGGKINFVADGGISITGDIDLTGSLKATGDLEDSIGKLSRLRQNYNQAQYVGNLGGLTSITNKVDA